MKNQEPKKISLFKDILNRRIPQIIGLYMAASWGLLQFVIWLVNEFALSPFLPQFSFVLLLTMLPTAIILSYFHGKPGKDSWTIIEKIGIPINVIFSIIVLIVFFHGKELGAAEKKVTVIDEAGAKIERKIIQNQFRKKIAIFAFENLSNDSPANWLKYAIPSLLESDLSQDMYIDVSTTYGFVEKIKRADLSVKEKLPLTLKLKLTRDSYLNFLFTGNFTRQNDLYHLETQLYEVKNGKLIAENTFSGQNIFNITDNMTIQLKRDLDIPQKHIENVKDLPVAEIVTSSPSVLRDYIQALNAQIFDNNYKKSIRHAESAVKADPLFTLGHIKLVELYFRSNRIFNGKNVLQKVMKQLYKLPERTQFEIKEFYYILEEQQVKRFAIIKMWADLYPEDIEAHYSLFNFYYNTSYEIDKAILEIERILEIDPTRYKYLHTLGGLFEKTGHYDEALKYYKQYAEQFPRKTRSFTIIGNYYKNTGEFDEANHYYEKALLLDPGDSDIMRALAEVERKTGHFIEAENQYKEALKNCQSPTQRGNVYGALRKLFSQQGQIIQAIHYLDLQSEERKKYSDPINQIFNEMFSYSIYIDIGKEDIAFAKIRNTKFEPPIDKALPLCRLELHLKLDDVENSEKELEKGKEFAESFGGSGFHMFLISARGKIHKLKKNYKTAIEYYQECLKNQFAYYPAMIQIGVCYKELKEYDKAIKSINDALKIFPANAEALYELSLVYVESGDKSKAIETLNDALNIWKNADPEFIPARKAREKLAELTHEIT